MLSVIYWTRVFYLVSLGALYICAVCFVAGGIYAIVYKDDPKKNTMQPPAAYAMIAAGAVAIFLAFFIWPKFFAP